LFPHNPFNAKSVLYYSRHNTDWPINCFFTGHNRWSFKPKNSFFNHERSFMKHSLQVGMPLHSIVFSTFRLHLSQTIF